MTCESAGWVLADNERYLLLAPSHKPPHKPGAGEVLSSLAIPRPAIVAIHRVTIGRRV
jgi:hypothetical protein